MAGKITSSFVVLKQTIVWHTKRLLFFSKALALIPNDEGTLSLPLHFSPNPRARNTVILSLEMTF